MLSSNCVAMLARLLLLALSFSIALQALPALSDELDERIGPLVERVTRLSERHVDVSRVVGELDRAVKLWDSGDRGEALRVVESVEVEVSRLEGEAGFIELSYRVKLYATVAALLATPILFYTLLPRLYLALWFRLRRGWVVRVASRR